MPGEDHVAVYDLYRQGCRRLDAGNPRAAAEVLELAVEHAPQSALLRETLARAYFASAAVGKARTQFEHALELDPTDAYAHFGVGRCHEREGSLAAAAKHYKLACALNGRSAYASALERVRRRMEAS